MVWCLVADILCFSLLISEGRRGRPNVRGGDERTGHLWRLAKWSVSWPDRSLPCGEPGCWAREKTGRGCSGFEAPWNPALSTEDGGSPLGWWSPWGNTIWCPGCDHHHQAVPDPWPSHWILIISTVSSFKTLHAAWDCGPWTLWLELWLLDLLDILLSYTLWTGSHSSCFWCKPPGLL